MTGNPSMKKPPETASAGHDARPIGERVNRVAWRAWKNAYQRLAFGRKPREHIFVAGMQRSGTNMFMDTLEWSKHTDVYHETDPRAFEHYLMRPVPVIRGLATHSSAPFFVIKALCELDRLPALMGEFAPAKTVWIVRDYNDCVNSATRSFGNFVDVLEAIGADRMGAGWRGQGMSDETHDLVRSLHHTGINEASAAAVMWYFRNILFFERGLDRNSRVLLVKYEKLVTSPPEEFGRIFRFLGIPDFSPWITRKISPRSVRKSRPPAIEEPVRAVCDGLTQRFWGPAET